MTGYGAGLNFTSKTVAKQIILLYMAQMLGRFLDDKNYSSNLSINFGVIAKYDIIKIEIFLKFQLDL